MSVDDTTVLALDAEVFEIPTDLPEGDGTLTWDSTVMVRGEGPRGRM